MIILGVYTIVEYTHRLDKSGHQAKRVINRENPQDELGVSAVMRHNICRTLHMLCLLALYKVKLTAHAHNMYKRGRVCLTK